MRIEVNERQCSGCRLCQQICTINRFNEINPKKAAIKIKAQFPSPGIFSPKLCDQCGVCAEVCPADAIEKKGSAYVIDEDYCTGCNECVVACPNDAICTHADEVMPIICNGCLKCVEICNTGALRVANG